MQQRNILIINDDGIGSEGLELLYRVASKFGKVTVFAPKQNQSLVSHSVTLRDPIEVREVKENFYSVDARPADCFRIAKFAKNQQIDFVLSGVNWGANLGLDAYYSGTVAAAREAFHNGIPAIALSQYIESFSEKYDWKLIEDWVFIVLDRFFEFYSDSLEYLKPKNYWVVNFPWPDVNGFNGKNTPEIVEPPLELIPCICGYQLVSEDNQKELFKFSAKFKNRKFTKDSDVDVCIHQNKISCVKFEYSNPKK